MNICLMLLAATIALISYHPQKGLIFPLSAIVVAYIYAAFMIILIVAVLSSLLSKFPRQQHMVVSLVLSVILVALAWIQIDYFLNSTLHFSSIGLYEKTPRYHFIQAVVVATIGLGFLYFVRITVRLPRTVIMAHLLAFAGVFVFLLATNGLSYPTLPIIPTTTAALPSIYIITVDSLEKAQLENESYFPRVSRHLGEFDRADYFYTNACCTHAALSVLYTGQTVDRTKVSYLPAYLMEPWRRTNLPNILKTLGYETHSNITGNVGNARKIGIDGGFDFIEGRQVLFFETHAFLAYIQNQTQIIMVLRKLGGDIFIRFYKFFIDSKTINPFDEVIIEEHKAASDKQKTDYLMELSGKEGTIFAHVHYMALHAIKRDNETKIAKILNQIDQQLEEVIVSLKKSGKWENTIFILSSDHGMRWSIDANLPLFIKTPDTQQDRKIGLEYTQMADIMPTILDLLGVEVELKFSGISIFHENPVARNFINLRRVDHNGQWKAPHYKIREFTIRNRERTTIIEAENFIWDEKGHLALEKILNDESKFAESFTSMKIQPP